MGDQSRQESGLHVVDQNAGFKTPEEPKRPFKVKRELDDSFVKENEENFDSDNELFDDFKKDPDWRKTPVGKWMQANKSKKRSTSKCFSLVNSIVRSLYRVNFM